ncbi:hypothetical protein [Bartonella krasnovii]|nr:hypothetical protein [Bartonella krasnovii]
MQPAPLIDRDEHLEELVRVAPTAERAIVQTLHNCINGTQYGQVD